MREYVGAVFRGSLYFYDSRLVIAASQTGVPGGLYAELQDPIVEPEPVSEDAVGFLAMQALLGFEPQPVPSMRDHKLTDWKTFRASGAASVKAFERLTTCVSIETFGTDLRLEAAPLIPNDSTFAVRALAVGSSKHEELGKLIRKLVFASGLLVDAGVV
jgi:hypothetical protein